MKKIIGSLLMLTVLLITFSSLDYVDASSYGTKASITFVDPEGEADKSEVENIPGGDLVAESQTPIPAGDILPKTATNNYSLLLLGLVIVFVGVSFFIYSNRKKKQSEIKI